MDDSIMGCWKSANRCMRGAAVESSSQAAEALRPIAGPFAEVIFALGVAGPG
jgi:hypothetical protein